MKKEIEKLKKSDRYRLNYHLMPIEGLINDPNGLIEKNGVYHVFYQVNDSECTHGAKKWGHYESKDMINWEIKDFALIPENWYDSHGCYSGSAILYDGKIHIFYTGNVKNSNGDRESYQCLAIENPDGTFEKLGPVIDEIPKGYTEHFRDPKVWEKNGEFYMVLGAQNLELKGEVLIYTSKDLKNWKLIKSLYNKNDLGYMIECPDLFELNGVDVLISSPQGIDSKEDLYNNLYQTGYIISLDNEHKSWSDFIELDRGFDFYAPQTFLDSKGRRIIYGWMGMEEKNHLSIEEGNWVHALTMPRELKIKDNKIIQKPLEELKKLRKNKMRYDDFIVENSVNLKDIFGDSFELKLEILNLNSESFGLKLRKNATEEIKLTFEKDKLILDREKTQGLKGTRTCEIYREEHKLHIFMDKSSIEIFYNDGEEVFTSRLYVSEDSKEIEFFSEGGKIIIKKLEFYELSAFEYL